MMYLYTIPFKELPAYDLQCLINRYPEMIRDMVQYEGWELDETAKEQLQQRLGKQAYGQIFRKPSKHYPL